MMISPHEGDKNINKYLEEMKEETEIYILELGKSITATSKKLGANVNTVCG